ncbi:hypothetical protein [Pseudoduganella umbonata]|uniref:Uncharacterized protein n=1 Tax=Pseudoduganella umbonata TaxID=864828 RepID=A0A4P8HIN9_9BURK|nr:hypothetical protein [Pseudoduganella umbonata]MBB3219439.1 hypothetical protein [Pseudoduganella umbonata]QCP09529.1 hypothetical protein FCL38_03145 [Pseudoduganella umbonata]
MRSNRVANGVGILMLIGGAPCLLAIATFVQLLTAHAAGTSSGGNAIGLMIMSLWAYGIAVASCAAGIIYFGYGALRYRVFPKPWHWFALVYSIGLVIIPIVYLISQ